MLVGSLEVNGKIINTPGFKREYLLKAKRGKLVEDEDFQRVFQHLQQVQDTPLARGFERLSALLTDEVIQELTAKLQQELYPLSPGVVAADSSCGATCVATGVVTIIG